MTSRLSIALVTRNRPDRLSRVLSSIQEQTVKPFEILISDDSTEMEMIERNKELAKQFGCTYISGPQNGLYANRNFVAKNCNGTHFRTMDDDHTFPKDHFEKCAGAIDREPETIWTIGEYFPGDEIKDTHPIPGQLHPRGFAYAAKNVSTYYGISCGGTIYPRKVVDNNDMNVEIFKFGLVYLEYGARLKSKGYTIKPILDTYLIHHNEETSASTLPKDIIEEARLFSMISFSYKYFPSVKNRLMTGVQILKDTLFKRISLQNVKNAYRLFHAQKNDM